MEAVILSPVQPSESATRKHHKFGPSRLEYLNSCAAFENRQSENTEYSEEGQFLHDRMDEMIKQVALGAYAETLPQISDWVTTNFDLTEEQIHYLRFCCKEVDALLARKPVKILSEINVSVKNEDGTEFNHGYLDILFIFANGTAVIIDFKFGYIPVPHAEVNLQGQNYATGSIQMFPEIQKVIIKFVQPKLQNVTTAVVDRKNVYSVYSELRRVVDQAKFVHANPDKAQQFMRVGPYCDYCALAGRCSMLANHRASFASQFGNLPVPVPIAGLTIDRPQDWALARYWVDVIDKGLEDFKKKAMEVAELSGGELSCELPNGEKIIYEMRDRASNRVLGDARSVAETLKGFVTEEEILGAAELALTKLKPIVETAMVSITNSQLQPGEKKLTKKAAWEQACSTLETAGLLSRPDTKIRFLQLKKQQKVAVEAPPAPLQLEDATPEEEKQYLDSLEPCAREEAQIDYATGRTDAAAGKPLAPTYSASYLKGYRSFNLQPTQ